MSRYFIIFLCVYFFIQIFAGSSCHHDPVVMEDIMEPMDTMGVPCDPEVVYFQFDVLPIFKSNCGVEACHDATTAQNDIILDSYDNIINSGKITAFDLEDSELYERITDTDLDDRMPPPPNNALNSNQIEVISKWILQGAKDLSCDPEEECDLIDVSFANFVYPILENNCIGCHSGGNPAGGQSLKTYDDIRPVAISGKLTAVISWEAGVPQMPRNSDQLDPCIIDKIKSWVQDGVLDN